MLALRSSGLLLIAVSVLGAATGCGSYTVDTVTFQLTAGQPQGAGALPSVYIDTNLALRGMFGGSVETRKPYSIRVTYTDPTRSYARLEITEVTVTAADGSEDPGVSALQLPWHALARETEVVNSGAGGTLQRTVLRVIDGAIPGAVTRDVPCTLRLKGAFLRDDGTRMPFECEHACEPVFDQGTQPWAEVMQGC